MLSKKPVINAAGITIFYIGKNTKAQMDFLQCIFKGNIGSLAGAMLVLHLNTSTHSQTVIKSSQFDSNGNVRKCHGSGLVLFFGELSRSSSMTTRKIYQPLQVINVRFTLLGSYLADEQLDQLGVVYIAVIRVKNLPMFFKFSHVYFSKNKSTLSGSCIYTILYASRKNNVCFILESIKALNNGLSYRNGISSMILPVSLFKFININRIIINGSATNPSHFLLNVGTVVEAIQSDITLEGHVVFQNNTSINGAAIMLTGDSLIYLTQGLRANFTNNTALTSGGAVYDLNSRSDVRYCTFQVNTTQYDDIAVLFENNKATVTGNSVFSSKLYNCHMNNFSWVNSTKAMKIYSIIFTHTPNNTFQLSTTPVQLTICHTHNSVIPYSSDAYPGQTINFSVAAIDAVGQHSYSIINIAAVRKRKHSAFTHINWWFSERENAQGIREIDDCTVINVTIYTNDNSTLDKPDGALLFTIPSIAYITIVDIKLKSCPPGFELCYLRGSCICSHVLLNIDGYTPNCSINTKTFNRPTYTSWAGSVQLVNRTSSIFLLSLYCHYGYCNAGTDLNVFHYTDEEKFVLTSKDLSSTSSLCLNNREGILCSKCSTVNGVNYSVVFGSTECRQCSNWWLWTLVLYAVAGPLLIYLLYALRLTLTTGTLNGIIFYAQLANTGLFDILSIKSGQCPSAISFGRKMAIFLISIMNLNLGFPLCFYNGMNELWKAGLSLLFPLYLLMIVVVLITFSRFSLRLSNMTAHSSVQVLVTVVHLSFSKLLLAIIDVFTPVQLYNSTMNEPINVWYNDGSVTYGDTNHMKLMIVTSVIVGIFLIPYMLIILTGRLLMKFNKIREYLRPMYEAIHAPYKYNKQYWFTARQLLLLFHYIIYTIYRGRSLFLLFTITHPIYSWFMIVQAFLKPFKNKLINILDLFVMINFGTIIWTNWYFINKKQICTAGLFDIIFAYALIFTFSVVVFYHIVLVTGQQARFIGYINVVKNVMKKVTQCLMKSQPVSHQRHFREDLDSSFFDDSYSEYREPLISP